MRKQEFLCELRKRLSGLPQQDVEERLNFYSEMIDDRMEEGKTEEEAVSDTGSVDEISAQIIADIPLTKIAKERFKPKRQLEAWEIVLLILGAPIWLSFVFPVIAVIFSLYAALWFIIASLWAVFVSLVCCAPAGVVTSIIFIFKGNGLTGLAMIGAGIACAGLAIFLFFGCMAATKGVILLTKEIILGIKKCFVQKEN